MMGITPVGFVIIVVHVYMLRLAMGPQASLHQVAHSVCGELPACTAGAGLPCNSRTSLLRKGRTLQLQ